MRDQSSGSQEGQFSPHLVTCGDIFDWQLGCGRLLLASGGERPGMLLNTLQRKSEPPSPNKEVFRRKCQQCCCGGGSCSRASFFTGRSHSITTTYKLAGKAQSPAFLSQALRSWSVLQQIPRWFICKAWGAPLMPRLYPQKFWLKRSGVMIRALELF